MVINGISSRCLAKGKIKMDFYICGSPLCRKIEFRLKGSCYSCGQNTYLHNPTTEELQPKAKDARNIMIGLREGKLSALLRWNGETDFTPYLDNPPTERARRIARDLLSSDGYGNFVRTIWEELDEKSARSRVTLN